MKFRLLSVAAATVLAALLACEINKVECDADCREEWMDGPGWNDSLFLKDSSVYRVVKRYPVPDASLLDKPVILAVHGFSASTYEWLEFWEWAEARRALDTTLVSLVLLGGHGLDVEDFRNSTWEDWGKPILQEYDSLVSKGYTNISIAASSTGCPLVLQQVASGEFRGRQAPKWIFLIDPIVTPSAKLLALSNLVGPILGNSPNDKLDTLEKHYWYTNRPEETLRELYELANLVKNRLEEGFKLPSGTEAKVWKAAEDGSADPVSALQIYKGLRKANGNRILVEMVDTRKHVYTRLRGRNPGSVNAADSSRQLRTFAELDSLPRS